jgi:hypothetical protein
MTLMCRVEKALQRTRSAHDLGRMGGDTGEGSGLCQAVTMLPVTARRSTLTMPRLPKCQQLVSAEYPTPRYSLGPQGQLGILHHSQGCVGRVAQCGGKHSSTLYHSHPPPHPQGAYNQVTLMELLQE